MKILNSISQLQDQISFCPLCQKKNRRVSIQSNSVETKIVHCREKDNKIAMRVHADRESKSKAIAYDLDIHSIDFDFIYSNKPDACAPNLDFLLLGNCLEGHANAAGIFSLNTGNKKVENIFYNKETLRILDTYRISALYYNDMLLVSSLNDSKVRSFPLMDLDFTRPDKIVTKIKTLLLFS